ncbi:putative RING finger protein [Colletotrichum sidae]|uniref:RING-type E3 ubiquitin transferase n=1 Tax=Colletotrichum sidae TaxID=1347389 RepID=A0A4R8TA20_9PEZI|nr:putative RING finger protein [Colletotrichum sidae]
MDSHSTRGGHLDATAGRDVVYCHACSNEWYQDEHGLQCPRCDSDIIEIVTPDNDPRLIEDGPPLNDSPDFGRHRHRLDDDSDPEEADIEEHLHRGPGGFVLHETIWNNSQRPGQSPSPNTRQPPEADGGDQIIRRFIDMVNDFGMGMPPRPAEESRPPAGFGGGGGGGSGLFGGGGNVRTFYRPGPGGTTSFTIASGPIHVHRGAHAHAGSGSDPFQSIFASVLGGGGLPNPGDAHNPGQGNRAAGGAAPNLIHEILNMLAPGNAAHGDAVYTQEALDRIISNLMEQNPQSNAAPPATEDALGKLERKKVDQKMLGPDEKTECTICIDEFKEGDDVAVLPCKHWFHDQCVVMWLKEHNTCPICRTPIEESRNSNSNDSGNPDGANNAGGAHGANNDEGSRGNDNAAPGSSGGPQNSFWDYAPPGMPGHFGGRFADFGGATFVARPIIFNGPPPVPADSTRPQRSPISDWDVPLPLYGSQVRDGSRNADLPPRPSGQDSSSRLPSFRSRRDSHSPPTARRNQPDGARARQRSPSTGNWERDRDSNNSNQDTGSSHGPLNWLRNTFSRGSGSGDNSSSSARDRRRL